MRWYQKFQNWIILKYSTTVLNKVYTVFVISLILITECAIKNLEYEQNVIN